FSHVLSLPPTSTLFPYTTLFRSRRFARCRVRTRAHLGFGAAVLRCALGRKRVRFCATVPTPLAGPDARRTRVGCVAGRCCHGAKDRKSTRLNSSHVAISYAVFCL